MTWKTTDRLIVDHSELASRCFTVADKETMVALLLEITKLFRFPR